MTDTVETDSPAVVGAAERLLTAARTGRACAPVRDLIGRDDAAAAYAVQQRLMRERVAGGATVVGRKIGLTAPAVQQQLGVDQPDFGMLFSDMAYGDGATVPVGRFVAPRVEAEVAFVLAADLADGDLDEPQVAAAVDHVVAALEICDSRVADWDISFADTVADNASAGAFVLGRVPVPLGDVDLVAAAMHLTVTGQPDSTGTGAACLGSPLLALQWLARQARAFGRPLTAGQVVLSGALGPMRAVTAGTHAAATITGLGAVEVRFTGEDA